MLRRFERAGWWQRRRSRTQIWAFSSKKNEKVFFSKINLKMSQKWLNFWSQLKKSDSQKKWNKIKFVFNFSLSSDCRAAMSERYKHYFWTVSLFNVRQNILYHSQLASTHAHHVQWRACVRAYVFLSIIHTHSIHYNLSLPPFLPLPHSLQFHRSRLVLLTFPILISLSIFCAPLWLYYLLSSDAYKFSSE